MVVVRTNCHLLETNMREVFEPSDTYQMEAAANNDAELSLLFNAASLTLGSPPPTSKRPS